MINFAHRGASQYAPENTMAAFNLGVKMGADGIETDVQETSDGKLVLFHDSSLKRTLSIDGSIRDYTWRELSKFDAGIYKGEEYRGEPLVLLEDFLSAFGHSGLHLAIEIKQVGIEEKVLKTVRQYVRDENFTITSFIRESVIHLASLPNRPQLGFLARGFSPLLLDYLKSIGINEYCPEAITMNENMVEEAARRNMRVRAWGVKTPELMEKVLSFDIYGMTVNFPDLLYKRLHDAI